MCACFCYLCFFNYYLQFEQSLHWSFTLTLSVILLAFLSSILLFFLSTILLFSFDFLAILKPPLFINFNYRLYNIGNNIREKSKQKMVLQNRCNNFDSIFLLTSTIILADNSIDAVVLFGLEFMKKCSNLYCEKWKKFGGFWKWKKKI